MSDTMLLGVLRMPVDENDPLCMTQFVQRARQAADRIESDSAEITHLQSELESAEKRIKSQHNQLLEIHRVVSSVGEAAVAPANYSEALTVRRVKEMATLINQVVMPDYQPKGSQCTACKHRNGPCSHLPFDQMPVCERLPDGTKVVICREFERRKA